MTLQLTAGAAVTLKVSRNDHKFDQLPGMYRQAADALRGLPGAPALLFIQAVKFSMRGIVPTFRAEPGKFPTNVWLLRVTSVR